MPAEKRHFPTSTTTLRETLINLCAGWCSCLTQTTCSNPVWPVGKPLFCVLFGSLKSYNLCDHYIISRDDLRARLLHSRRSGDKIASFSALSIGARAIDTGFAAACVSNWGWKGSCHTFFHRQPKHTAIFPVPSLQSRWLR